MNKFRYVDKSILCSYDLSEDFFQELGINVYDIIPLRKVFVIFTDKGKKILKKIRGHFLTPNILLSKQCFIVYFSFKFS